MESLLLDSPMGAETPETGVNASILVLGDSIARGVTYDENRGRHALLGRESFCALVAKELRLSVENRSKFGCMSGAALRILEKRLSAGPAPSMVAIEIGGNDCDFDWEAVAAAPGADHSPKASLTEYEQNLTAMIAVARRAGAAPVLFNLPPIDAERYFRFFTGGDEKKAARILEFLGSVGRIYWWHERYNAAAERVAQSTRTPLVMIRGALLHAFDYRAYVSGDGLHPNAAGHQRMAEAVLADIRRYRPGLLARQAPPC